MLLKLVVCLLVVVKEVVDEGVPDVVEVFEGEQLVVGRCLLLVELEKLDQGAERRLGVEEESSLVPVYIAHIDFIRLQTLHVIIIKEREVLSHLVELRDAREDAIVVQDLDQLVGKQPVGHGHQPELVADVGQLLERLILVLEGIVEDHVDENVVQRQDLVFVFVEFFVFVDYVFVQRFDLVN